MAEFVFRSTGAMFGALLLLTIVFRGLERWRWRGVRRGKRW